MMTLRLTRPTTTRDDACRLLGRGRHPLNRHGILLASMPWLIERDDGTAPAMAPADALPVADASIDAISCRGALEYVRDDEAAVAEWARALRPGGTVTLTVPMTGPLAGLDGLNLYEYLASTTQLGPRAPEIREIGWRRHYGLSDLTEFLGVHGFEIVASRTHGWALGELAHAAAMTFVRVAIRRESLLPLLRARFRRLADIESDRPALGFGFWITIQARRR